MVLLSAGIGATPVLAMLYALASARSTRPVWWLHAARDRQHHPFAAEVRRLMPALTHGRSYVCYSRPGSDDKIGRGFRRGRSPVAIGLRRDRHPARGGCLPVRAHPLHGRHERDARSSGRGAGADSRRTLQRQRVDDPRHRRRSDANSASARGRRQHRSAGIVRAKWHRRTLEGVGLPEHPGVGRGVRRPGPLVVPDRCLSQLRERFGFGRGRLCTASRSICPPTATFSFAAHNRLVTSSSICKS